METTITNPTHHQLRDAQNSWAIWLTLSEWNSKSKDPLIEQQCQKAAQYYAELLKKFGA